MSCGVPTLESRGVGFGTSSAHAAADLWASSSAKLTGSASRSGATARCGGYQKSAATSQREGRSTGLLQLIVLRIGEEQLLAIALIGADCRLTFHR